VISYQSFFTSLATFLLSLDPRPSTFVPDHCLPIVDYSLFSLLARLAVSRRQPGNLIGFVHGNDANVLIALVLLQSHVLRTVNVAEALHFKELVRDVD